MKKDNQFQINSIQNEQASSRIVPLVLEVPPHHIYCWVVRFRKIYAKLEQKPSKTDN